MNKEQRLEAWQEWYGRHPPANTQLRQWLPQSKLQMANIHDQTYDLETVLHTSKDPKILHETNKRLEELRIRGRSLSGDRHYAWTY